MSQTSTKRQTKNSRHLNRHNTSNSLKKGGAGRANWGVAGQEVTPTHARSTVQKVKPGVPTKH